MFVGDVEDGCIVWLEVLSFLVCVFKGFCLELWVFFVECMEFGVWFDEFCGFGDLVWVVIVEFFIEYCIVFDVLCVVYCDVVDLLSEVSVILCMVDVVVLGLFVLL